jgi:hypothetical protein
VETPWEVEVIYTQYNDTGARREVYYAYKKAAVLADQRKYAESNAILMPLFLLDRLNFYERSTISYGIARNSLGLQDYDSALTKTREAMIPSYEYFSLQGRSDLLQLRIKLEARAGQFGDALEWYDALKKLPKKKGGLKEMPADLVALKDRIEARLRDPQPIIVIASILPDALYQSSWQHVMLRRSFAFLKTDGKLDHFELGCDEQTIVSKLSNKAEWHIPKNWENCKLTVYGEPGATFTLAEILD